MNMSNIFHTILTAGVIAVVGIVWSQREQQATTQTQLAALHETVLTGFKHIRRADDMYRAELKDADKKIDDLYLRCCSEIRSGALSPVYKERSCVNQKCDERRVANGT